MADKTLEKVDELAQAEEALAAAHEKVLQLRRQSPAETIKDYELKDKEGNPVALSSLFGEKDDLILIHNMGQSCSYCTLWADGFMGLHKHLEDRAGFVVVSHDKPEVMKEFAEGRGWQFTMLSNDGSSFTRDMGYENESGGPTPGISTFHKDGEGNITRIAHTWFGPGDDFCAVWPILDMLKDGNNDWQPKYEY